jgi:hypothetical protein
LSRAISGLLTHDAGKGVVFSPCIFPKLNNIEECFNTAASATVLKSNGLDVFVATDDLDGIEG